MATKKKAIKKAAAKKAAPPANTTKRGLVRDGRAGGGGADTASTATLHVEFRSVNPDLSNFTANHDDEEKTINQSGPISFDDVKIGDTIDIDGDSPGKTIVTVSGVNTRPPKMEFAPGQHISGIFFIIP